MDVIHSFFLPNFRVKQDAMPGMTIEIWFTPTELTPPTPLEIACAEHCGLGHYRMRGQVHVVPAAEFDARSLPRPPSSPPHAGEPRWPTAAEAHAAEAHAHAPQAFIWRYVFSKDHKVIGIQYYVTAMLMALIAGPAGHADPRPARPGRRGLHAGWASSSPWATTCGGRGHEPRVLRHAVHDARHHHGVLRALHRAR